MKKKQIYKYSYKENKITKVKHYYEIYRDSDYCEAVKGISDGIYCDTFSIFYNNNEVGSSFHDDDKCEIKYLDFWYTEEQKPFYEKLRNSHLNKHLDLPNPHVRSITRERITFPPKVFDELLKKY